MRRMSWMAVIPALALSCAMGSKEEKPSSEAVKTQSQAQAALQRAADGQKRALGEQQKALADAQARLSAQRAKAQQAQKDAQRLSADAQQEAQRQQTQAMQLQQQQAQTSQQQMQQNQQSFMQTRNVSGQAVSANKDEILLRSSDQGDVRLKLNDSTSITVDGKMGTGEQIQPGEDVRATYQLIDGQPVAVKIDATSSGSRSNSSDTSQPKQ